MNIRIGLELVCIKDDSLPHIDMYISKGERYRVSDYNGAKCKWIVDLNGTRVMYTDKELQTYFNATSIIRHSRIKNILL